MWCSDVKCLLRDAFPIDMEQQVPSVLLHYTRCRHTKEHLSATNILPLGGLMT
jgi:hypothetical protein